jgi:hypothetical protein
MNRIDQVFCPVFQFGRCRLDSAGCARSGSSSAGFIQIYVALQGLDLPSCAPCCFGTLGSRNHFCVHLRDCLSVLQFPVRPPG